MYILDLINKLIKNLNLSIKDSYILYNKIDLNIYSKIELFYNYFRHKNLNTIY